MPSHIISIKGLKMPSSNEIEVRSDGFVWRLFYFMAIFRKVEVKFWSDSFVESLTPEQKYFYLYLMTNEKTTQCGIYECSIRKMSIDTGYNQETIEKLLEFFQNKKKIHYSKATNEICLTNWLKYNDSTSHTVKKCIENELLKVKNRVLIQYLYSMDTHSQEEEEKEEEQEKEKKEVKEKKQEFLESEFFINLFDNLWFSYGRKGSKKKALQEVYKLSEEDLKSFCESEEHIKAYVENTKDEPKFRKDFERYISNKYWESDIFNSKKLGKIGKTLQTYNDIMNSEWINQ